VKRTALLIGLMAALGMGGGSPVAGGTLRVAMCHAGFLDLPIKGGKPARDKSCPFGCHAPLCQERKKRTGRG